MCLARLGVIGACIDKESRVVQINLSTPRTFPPTLFDAPCRRWLRLNASKAILGLVLAPSLFHHRPPSRNLDSFCRTKGPSTEQITSLYCFKQSRSSSCLSSLDGKINQVIYSLARYVDDFPALTRSGVSRPSEMTRQGRITVGETRRYRANNSHVK